MRIGFGNDIHRLAEGRTLWLGGIPFPEAPKGEVAHSDGDVLIHALIDAILGAFGDGDIGTHFPPSSEKWKDADSRELLKMVVERDKPRFVNIDSTITLEGFKLMPHKEAIRESLATLLGLEVSQVSVKAKTNEGMGELGRGEAIKAEVVVLLEN